MNPMNPMNPMKNGADPARRRGAPWTEAEDERLLRIAAGPPRVVARLMGRSWHACRRRLAYLRAAGRAKTR